MFCFIILALLSYNNYTCVIENDESWVNVFSE